MTTLAQRLSLEAKELAQHKKEKETYVKLVHQSIIDQITHHQCQWNENFQVVEVAMAIDVKSFFCEYVELYYVIDDFCATELKRLCALDGFDLISTDLTNDCLHLILNVY
jgi:hypothetical protein